MQSIRLIINGENVELPNDITIPVTLQSQDIGNITERVGSYSRSFVIKATSHNRRILDNSFTFQSDTTFPYRSSHAILIVNGLQFAEGSVIIENDGIGIDEIRLTFYTGNSTFFQLIAGKQLRQLCYKTAQHFNWTQQILATLVNQNEDFMYPIVAYRDNTLDISLGGVNRVSCGRLYPALTLSYVLNRIAEIHGYTIDSSLDGTLFEKIIFPYSNAKFERDKYYENRNNWLSKYTTTQAINLTGTLPYTDPNCPWFDLRISETDANGYATNFDTTTCARFSLVNPNTYALTSTDRIRVRYTITLRFELSNDRNVYVALTDQLSGAINTDWLNNTTSTSTEILTQLSYDGGLTAVDGVWSLAGNTVLLATQDYYDTTIVTEAFTTPHQNLRLSVWTDAFISFQNVSVRCEYLSDNATSETDRAIVLEQYFFDINWSKSLVSPSMCLPDMTVSVFLKTIAQMFGVLFLIDEPNKIVKIRQLDDVIRNTGRAKDWSDKLVNHKLSFWNTRPSAFAQLNKFSYTNEPPLEDDYGAYEMTIDDTTLENEKDVVKLPFSATDSLKRLSNYYIGYIQRLDASGIYVGGSNTKQRVLFYNNSNNINIEYKYSDGTNNLTFTTTQNILGQFEYYPAGNGLRWSNIATLFYSDIFNYVKKYKELTVYAILSPVDVQNIDYEIPIYLKQYNAFFFIQKIQDWLPNKPTKIQLLKLT